MAHFQRGQFVWLAHTFWLLEEAVLFLQIWFPTYDLRCGAFKNIDIKGAGFSQKGMI